MTSRRPEADGEAASGDAEEPADGARPVPPRERPAPTFSLPESGTGARAALRRARAEGRIPDRPAAEERPPIRLRRDEPSTDPPAPAPPVDRPSQPAVGTVPPAPAAPSVRHEGPDSLARRLRERGVALDQPSSPSFGAGPTTGEQPAVEDASAAPSTPSGEHRVGPAPESRRTPTPPAHAPETPAAPTPTPGEGLAAERPAPAPPPEVDRPVPTARIEADRVAEADPVPDPPLQTDFSSLQLFPTPGAPPRPGVPAPPMPVERPSPRQDEALDLGLPTSDAGPATQATPTGESVASPPAAERLPAPVRAFAESDDPAEPMLPGTATGTAPDPTEAAASLGAARGRRKEPLPARPAGPTGRAVPSPPPRRAAWRRVLFGSTLVVLLVAGAALAYAGARTVSDSTDGKIVEVTEDPEAPGFEAFVTPSPTMLVIHRDGADVQGYTFLALGPGDVGGAVLFIPTATLAELPSFGDQPVSLAYEGGGVPVATQVIQELLGVGILETVEIDDPRWTSLTEPVAPFTIDNPDAVVVDDEEVGSGVLFPAGEIEVEADGVGQFLGSSSVESQTELNRLVRNELLWEAWLEAVAGADDPGAVPGETDSGIGRFVKGLAAGEVEIMTLPVDEVDDPAFPDQEVFEPEELEIESLVTDLVPLPTSPAPGVRPKVRLLNGTSERELLGPIVPDLVAAGAEVAIFGNASTFDEPETQIIFSDAAFADEARDLQDALGIGELVRVERPVENIDITIVIGTDYTGGGG